MKLHIVIDKDAQQDTLYLVKGAESQQEAVSMVNFNLNEQGTALNQVIVYAVELPEQAERAVWAMGKIPK